MKVTMVDKEINSYVKSLRVEVEGEVYHVDLTYDNWSGFDIKFIDNNGRNTDWPKWAENYDNGTQELMYDLDEMSEREGE